jgi:putative flippase GtrA
MIQAVARREGVRQFIKFCIVGASSTLIDLVIYFLLIEGFHLQRLVGNIELTRMVAQCISFVFSVSNGFYWNSRWTFRGREATGGKQRYGKFVLTNLIGLSLNIFVLNQVARVVPASLLRVLDPHLHDPAGFIGKLTAICVVVFWNFTASKYWTFRS